MDGSRFDQLARSVAGRSRRSLLKSAFGVALGGVLAGIGLGETSAAQVKRKPGEICRKNGDCASGLCGPKDATGRQYCHCITPADCPQPPAGSICKAATCTAGVCGIAITAGATCSDGDACTTGETCDAQGACLGGTPVTCPPASDACHIAGTCTPATGCSPETTAPDGTPCGALMQCTNGTCGACTGVHSDYGNSDAAACTTSAECCQTEITACLEVDGCRTGPQCCHSLLDSCTVDCDCCGSMVCNANNFCATSL